MTLIGIVDLETTGLGKFDRANPARDDYPISIGIVIADIDEEAKTIHCVDSYYSLIRIPNPFRAEELSYLHHIFPGDLENAPRPRVVCDEILNLLEKYGDVPLGAWNHQFDHYFVNKLFSMARMNPPALKWMEMQPERMASLERWVTKYVDNPDVLELNAHDALNDCIRTISVIAAIRQYELDMTQIVQPLSNNLV